MYECSRCHNVYKTRTSLTRHSHNHADHEAGHACGQCNVSFARRDLLTRHLRSSHTSVTDLSRQRCHTACTACHLARTRCDGQMPCQPCSASQKPCQYNGRRHRISKNVPRRQSSLATASSGPPMDDATPAPSNLQDRLGSTLLQPNHQPTQDFTESRPLSPLPFDLDGLSWPWLHETLFLHQDPRVEASGSLFGTPNGAGGLSVDAFDALLQGDLPAVVPNGALQTHVYAARKADVEARLESEIGDLVEFASKQVSESAIALGSLDYWRKASSRVDEILGDHVGGTLSGDNDKPLLERMTALYIQNFNRLWPMFSTDGFHPHDLHPILFLVLVSIGSMYGTAAQKRLGTLLHKRLRRLLTASLFDLEGPEGDLVWLAHARLLTQVQGLYFGQQQGFSYAQHLGAILIAQARRLDIFSRPSNQQVIGNAAAGLTAEAHLARWKGVEMRKRLAFGILRADVYTSVLLNTRPLMAHEDVDLLLPCSDALWHNNDRLSAMEHIIAVRVEERCSPETAFSDLLRILLDRQEAVPSLGIVGYELCLFGIQQSVWKFAHDPNLFPRLTGESCDSTLSPFENSSMLDGVQEIGSTSATTTVSKAAKRISSPYEERPSSTQTASQLQSDTLGQIYRSMQDLKADRCRVQLALERCRSGIQSARRSPDHRLYRDNVMSSTLLWHVSHLQLCAPLQDLHAVSYKAADARIVDASIVKRILDWLHTDHGRFAVQRATAICSLIHSELERPPAHRAAFNFLAFGSLHHAAVVLWAFADAGPAFRGESGTSSVFDSLLKSRDTRGLLQACARLFLDLSPVGGAPFGSAAERLSVISFPRLAARE